MSENKEIMTSAIILFHLIVMCAIFGTASTASLPSGTTKTNRRFPSFPQLYRPEDVARSEKLVLHIAKRNGSRLVFPSFPQIWTPEDTAAAARLRSVNKRSLLENVEMIADDTASVNESSEVETHDEILNDTIPDPVFAEAVLDSADVEDVCISNPCLHDGICLATGLVYACACSVRYEGDHCEKDLGACLTEPCHNGGTCEAKGDSFVCKCKQGFFGSHCHVHLTSCDSYPCMNGGTCHDEEDVAEFICVCTPHFFGKQCEIEMSAGQLETLAEDVPGKNESVFAEANMGEDLDAGSDTSISDDGVGSVTEPTASLTTSWGEPEHDGTTITPSPAARPVPWSGLWMILMLPVPVSVWRLFGWSSGVL